MDVNVRLTIPCFSGYAGTLSSAAGVAAGVGAGVDAGVIATDASAPAGASHSAAASDSPVKNTMMVGRAAF
jgi:hypothetical protein